MSQQGKFMVYCAEIYKTAKRLNGRQLEALFSENDVWQYLYDCADALHTTGNRYIVDDIDAYIASGAR